MKTRMKWEMRFAVMLFAIITITCCYKDDKPKNPLIGVWRDVERPANDNYLHYEYRENGTFVYWREWEGKTDPKENERYTYNGKILTKYTYSSSGYPAFCKINGDIMTLMDFEGDAYMYFRGEK